MFLDEEVLYNISPLMYPKPKTMKSTSLKPKTKQDIIEENDIFHFTKRKSQLEVSDFKG